MKWVLIYFFILSSGEPTDVVQATYSSQKECVEAGEDLFRRNGRTVWVCEPKMEI